LEKTLEKEEFLSSASSSSIVQASQKRAEIRDFPALVEPKNRYSQTNVAKPWDRIARFVDML